MLSVGVNVSPYSPESPHHPHHHPHRLYHDAITLFPSDATMETTTDEANEASARSASPVRRRRFVKSGMTSYEQWKTSNPTTSTGRRLFHRRPQDKSTQDTQTVSTIPEQPVQEASKAERLRSLSPPTRAQPAVSSLSSVMREVINGRPRALSSLAETKEPASEDTVAAALPPRIYLDTIHFDPPDEEEEEESQRTTSYMLELASGRRRWPSRRSLHRQTAHVTDRTSLLDFSTVKTRKAISTGNTARLSELVQGSFRPRPSLLDGILLHSDEIHDDTHDQADDVEVQDADNEQEDEDPVILLEPDDVLPMLGFGLQSSMSLDSIDLHPSESDVDPDTAFSIVDESKEDRVEEEEEEDVELPHNAFQHVRDIDFAKKRPGEEESALTAAIVIEDHSEEDGQGASIPASGPVRDRNATVVEFLGGFKGMSSRGRKTGHDGVMSRAKAVRRKTAAAQAFASALIMKQERLARRLQEARDRVPDEFRDEAPENASGFMGIMTASPPQKMMKIKNPFRLGNKRVRFDMTKYCREYEVESDDDNDQPGHDEDDQYDKEDSFSGNEGDDEAMETEATVDDDVQ